MRQIDESRSELDQSQSWWKTIANKAHWKLLPKRKLPNRIINMSNLSDVLFKRLYTLTSNYNVHCQRCSRSLHWNISNDAPSNRSNGVTERKTNLHKTNGKKWNGIRYRSKIKNLHFLFLIRLHLPGNFERMHTRNCVSFLFLNLLATFSTFFPLIRSLVVVCVFFSEVKIFMR